MKNKCLFWGGIILLWIGAVAGTLWSKGYHNQPHGQLVSDEEIVRMVVRRALIAMEINPPEIGTSKPNQIVLYRDEDHFLAENPDCCVVKQQPNRHLKTVDVYGKIFYRDKIGQIKSSEPILLIDRQYFPSKKIYRLP